MASRRWLVAATSLFLIRDAIASPNVDLDDPFLTTPGARSATESSSMRSLSIRALDFALGRSALPRRLQFIEDGLWVAAAQRLEVTTQLLDVSRRPYTTTLRPRNIVGELSVACMNREAKPCGDAIAAWTDLESSAGYGTWASATVRIRASTEHHFEFPRAYLTSDFGPLMLEAGRDVIVVGPSERTQLGWSRNPPPLDQLRVATARPLHLTSLFSISGHYVIGHLSSPQTYPGTLVTLARGQLNVDTVHVGIVQMLQLGGEGAPQLGPWDFVAEHFRRGDSGAGADDTSNRRFGGDVSFRIESLGTRFYYEVIFEDIRRRHFVDAVRYDADHLLGVQVSTSGHAQLVGEWRQTGARSQEHQPRITGFTSGAYLTGNPDGPDSHSVFIGANISRGAWFFRPWAERVSLKSDVYAYTVNGPITPSSEGPVERRMRGGTSVRYIFRPSLWFEAAGFVEHVSTVAFNQSESRLNSGLTTSLVWSADGSLRTMWRR